MAKYNLYVEDVSVEAVFNKLGGVAGAKRFLRGDSKVVIKVTIDCDADPYDAAGFKVEEHIKGGYLKWNPDNVALYLTKRQKNGERVNGHELRKKLKNKPVLNANVLDFLLANPDLIPKEWKSSLVYFWGTIYSDPYNKLFVRYLLWDDDDWHWNYSQLSNNWGVNSSAAIDASN